MEDDSLKHIASKASEFAEMFQDPLTSWWPWIFASVVGLVVCLKTYMGGIDCPSRARIEKKVVVITGASSGIGLETAKEIARRGGHLILGCRNTETGEEAANEIRQQVLNADVRVLHLNLCSFASIRQFVNEIDCPAVDVLINNAGVVFHPEGRTEDGYEFHLQTNYLGPFLLTHLLLPKLKMKEGRVINVSAVAQFAGDIYLENFNLEGCFSAREAFAQSKLAVTMMTIELAKRLQGSGVTVNALHPGMVRGTNHMRHSPFSSSIFLKAPMLPWLWILTKAAKQGAQTAIYLAVDPGLTKTTGKYFTDCQVKEPSEKAKDEILLRNLYEKTCQIVNVKEIKCPAKQNNK